MVVAMTAFYMTKSLDDTLKHTRKTLNLGGKLLYFEITVPNAICLQFGLSILPG